MFLAWLIVSLVVFAPNVGAQSTIRPDSGFGVNGRALGVVPATSPNWNEATVKLAKAPSGDLILAAPGGVLAYLPDGRLDSAFGNHGSAPVAIPSGAKFSLVGLAVDAQGRITLAGTMIFPEELTQPPPGDPLLQPRPRVTAALYRYQPDGRPDPTFGNGGLLLTGLGLPTPVLSAAFSRSGAYGAAEVSVSGLALDSTGRMVLTGSFVAEIAECRDYAHAPLSSAFIARLTPEGQTDPTFSGGAARIDSGLASTVSPLISPDGKILYSGARKRSCESPGPAGVGRLQPSGVPDPSFAHSGWRSIPEGPGTFRLAVDRQGRILGLGGELVRLTPNGSLDTSFGKHGAVELHPPGRRSYFTSVTTDRKGRVLLVGARIRPHRYTAFLAARYTAKGKPDVSFGPGAYIETRFGANSTAAATALMLTGSGRLLLAGLAASSAIGPGQGVALLAYRLGR